MSDKTGYDDIKKQKQNQILKLVTHSFYRELLNYGVDTSDIVTVSVNLLDFVTKSQKNQADSNNGYYNDIFTVADIRDNWIQHQTLSLQDVTLRPLREQDIPAILDWLHLPEINQTFIRFLPKEKEKLSRLLLQNEANRFFAIDFQDKHSVGFMGAERMDHHSRKLEMKKLVGNRSFRGKGIGKLATFLFLYYAFEILRFNKVYIYSLDTNIKNINLNSKFGFELEGILYSETMVDNDYRDVLRMGLIKENWMHIFSSPQR